MKLALAVILVLAHAHAGSAVAADVESKACVGAVRRDVDELSKRFMLLGAKGIIVAASCDTKGNLSELTIQRPRDKRVTRWKPQDGLTALIDRTMKGE